MAEQILYVALMIGGLIFFHELGHFILARVNGVHVVEFSIGFGPRVFSWKGKQARPDLPPTEYIIAALPVGGYVRMLGADPGEDVPDEIRDVSLNFKPVWRRLLISAAGPAFNLILPLIIFFFLGLTQTERLPSVAGTVDYGGPAWEAGVRSGDVLTAIDGEPVRYWEDISEHVERHADQPIAIAWDRFGEPHTATITPAAGKKEIIPKILYDDVGKIGVGLSYTEAIVGVEPGSAAETAGLKSWDHIVTVGGQRVRSLDEALFIIEKHAAEAITLGVIRYQPHEAPNLDLALGEPQTITLPAAPDAPTRGVFGSGCLVWDVLAGSPAAEAGLRRGDRVLALDGHACISWLFARSYITQHREEGVQLTWRRGAGDEATALIKPKLVPWPLELDPHNKAYLVGIETLYETRLPDLIPIEDRLGHATGLMFSETGRAIRGTLAVIGGLLSGQVAIREGLGGPGMIAQLTAKTSEYGASYFFGLMALLSVSLGLINLLPIPVLDGGTIMFLIIEGIRRKPVSMRIRMIATYIGLAFIVILMVVVLRYDLERCWS